MKKKSKYILFFSPPSISRMQDEKYITYMWKVL